MSERMRGRSPKTMPESGRVLAVSPTTRCWHEVVIDRRSPMHGIVIDEWRGKRFAPLAWAPLPIKPKGCARP